MNINVTACKQLVILTGSTLLGGYVTGKIASKATSFAFTAYNMTPLSENNDQSSLQKKTVILVDKLAFIIGGLYVGSLSLKYMKITLGGLFKSLISEAGVATSKPGTPIEADVDCVAREVIGVDQ